MAEENPKNIAEIEHTLASTLYVIIPAIVFFAINLIILMETLDHLQDLYEVFRDSQYILLCGLGDLLGSLVIPYFSGTIIFSFFLIVFRKTLRKSVRTVRIVIIFCGMLLLFLVGYLLYLELRFSLSLFQLTSCGQRDLRFILWNIAFLGIELLLLRLLQGKKTIGDKVIIIPKLNINKK
jgi:hypothetical protein